MKRTPLLVAAAAALALTAAAGVAHAAPQPDRTASPAASGDCLWFGPTFTADASDLNYAFPDSGAHYWAARFTIPAGASLDLTGKFAHARYQSLNAYDDATHAPVDAVNDTATTPDKGSRNPYLPGALRAGDARRSYTVHVSTDTLPSPKTSTGTLYAGVAGQTSQLVLYRVYLPDKGRDLTGGAGLPKPRLRLADGTTLTGAAACSALQAKHETPAVDLLPLATYRYLRNQPGTPATYPAKQDPVWLSYYNTQFNLGCAYLGACAGTPARINAQYANVDNKYVSALISRGFGPVLTLRGKLPRTPRTLGRQPFLDPRVDMRYWSLCSNESMLTTRVADCVNDEQVPTDRTGTYTILVSRAADRPRNATAACGVAWLAWPERGDGDGHLDDGFLILRNMLPTAAFGHAVQDTKVPGDEKQVMGAYLPASSYGTKAAFEQQGCRRH